jgi:glycosyltransferase involved in cell wall biosynthesis
MKRLDVLLWRKWTPLFDPPATFSALFKHSMGGTDSQLLWHARNLVQMGHRVQVLGVARTDIVEEQVEFIGASNQEEQVSLIESGHIREPNVVFLEGAFAAAEFFKSYYPKAKIVHVGQNIDRAGHRPAFKIAGFVDVYGFVGIGQLADYCVRFPHLRHKFLLLRNIVPWYWFYQKLESRLVQDHIVWMGSWQKKGLRQWAEAMQRILYEHPSYVWTLCGPSYETGTGGLPTYVFHGLELPRDRVVIKNLPLMELIPVISSARIVLASLGNECGPISILDAHSTGRPVLSGNDMVYKLSNPEGTGVRVTTPDECYAAISRLINDPQLGDALGAMGKEMVLAEYTEKNQFNDLLRILEYLEIADRLGTLANHVAPSAMRVHLGEYQDKVKRKTLQFMALLRSRGLFTHSKIKGI